MKKRILICLSSVLCSTVPCRGMEQKGPYSAVPTSIQTKKPRRELLAKLFAGDEVVIQDRLSQRKRKLAVLKKFKQFSSLNAKELVRFVHTLPENLIAHTGNFILYLQRKTTMHGIYPGFITNDQRLIASDNQGFYIFDDQGVLTDYTLQNLQPALAKDSTGQRLAALTQNNEILLQDTKANTTRTFRVNALWCKFNPSNNQEILYSDNMSGVINGLDISTGTTRTILTPRNALNRFCLPSPDKQHLLLYGDPQTPEIWDLEAPEEPISLQSNHELEQRNDQSQLIGFVLHNYNGSVIARFYETYNSRGDRQPGYALHNSDDGKQFFSENKQLYNAYPIEGTNAFVIAEPGGYRVLNLDNVKTEEKKNSLDHCPLVVPCSYTQSDVSPNGKIIAVINDQGTIVSWYDSLTGQKRTEHPIRCRVNDTRLQFLSNDTLAIRNDTYRTFDIIQESKVGDILDKQEQKVAPQEYKTSAISNQPHPVLQENERTALAQKIEALLKEKYLLPQADISALQTAQTALATCPNNATQALKVRVGELRLKAHKYDALKDSIEKLLFHAESYNEELRNFLPFTLKSHLINLVHRYSKKYSDPLLLTQAASLDVRLQALLPNSGLRSIYPSPNVIEACLTHLGATAHTKAKLDSIEETIIQFEERASTITSITDQLKQPYDKKQLK